MERSAKAKHRVVIVGLGFAGINTYINLVKHARKDELEITAVCPTDTFTLIPLIHEVASGLLRPGSITESLRNSVGLSAHEFIEGTATSVDLEKKVVSVHTTTGITQDVAYDTLVVGIGSTTNFMNVSGAEEHSLTLKTLEDAQLIKDRVLAQFDDAADRIRANEPGHLDIVIVGGGATGVELAGELADFLKALARSYPDVHVPYSVTVMDGGDALVKAAKPWMGEAAYKVLTKDGIKVMLNMRVKEVTPEGVQTESQMVHADIVIWTAGVKAQELTWLPAGAVTVDERSRRVPVTELFTLQNYNDVYVLGDQATAANATVPYPMRAQIARKEGKATARNIIRKVRGEQQKPYDWSDWGIILTFGEGGGVAELRGVRLRGFPAWIIYRGTYLFSLVGTRARLRTGLEWLINLFKMRDLGKV